MSDLHIFADLQKLPKVALGRQVSHFQERETLQKEINIRLQRFCIYLLLYDFHDCSLDERTMGKKK